MVANDLPSTANVEDAFNASWAAVSQVVESEYRAGRLTRELVAARSTPRGIGAPDGKCFALRASKGRPSLDTFLAHAHDGSIRADRALSLAAFVALCRPSSMLEIGGFLGLSSNLLLRLTRTRKSLLHSVDPGYPHRCIVHPRRIFGQVNAPFSAAGRLRMVDAFWRRASSRTPQGHEGRTISARYFVQRGLSFDFAFIDGDHDRETVLNDFRSLRPLMRRHGCVAFDDVDAEAWPGTYAALLELRRQLARNGTVLFGDQMALFIDRGFFPEHRGDKIESTIRTVQKGARAAG